MSLTTYENVGSIGIVKDIEPHLLPPSAWSDGLNVRMWNAGVERFGGHVEVYPTPAVPPLNVLLAKTESILLYWLYTSTQEVYAVDADSGIHTKLTYQLPAASALTSALDGAGNLSIGLYTWKVAFVSAEGIAIPGAVSNTINITDPGVNGKVLLSNIPIGPVGTIFRYIYRTTAGGSVYKLSRVLLDNSTTTSSDNIADVSLGIDAPAANTAELHYNASEDIGWSTATIGGVPILNNGADVPQMWLTKNIAKRLEALTAWPADTTCAVLKAYKQYLIALDITKVAVRYPYMVKWSHQADPGTVPNSWDEADPTKDAGEYELKDDDGYLVNSLQLGDINVIYKEETTWGMQYIGGAFIFRFYNIFTQLGLLSRRCVEEFEKKHFLITDQYDIVLHNGQSVQPLADKRMQKWLANNADPTYRTRSFVIAKRKQFEMWYCFAEVGATYATKALVWNWREPSFTVRDLPAVSDIGYGFVPAATDPAVAWDTDTGTWDSDTKIWNTSAQDHSGSDLLYAVPNGNESLFFLGDSGNLANNVPFIAYIERTGLSFVETRTGLAPDTLHVKFITAVYPQLVGTLGTIVKVYVGGQYKIDDPILWSSPQDFIIGAMTKIDCFVEGVYWAIRFESTADASWRLLSYKADVAVGGVYTDG